MFKISSNKITEGMILARSITNAGSQPLLTAGQEFTARYVERIKELEIPFVYIDDMLGIQEYDPPVRESTVLKATVSLKEYFEQYAKTGQADLQVVYSQVDNIINDLVANSQIIIGMSELKNYDDYTYQHSVNVCVLSLIIGMSQGYSYLQLSNLGVGAILHDIGKIKIPLEILNKPSPLSYEEYIEVKKHPFEGYQIINSLRDFPPSSALAILQHHERLDKRGYPRGLSGKGIHDYGLIVAVADVFDALVSDRPYRIAFSNQEAMKVMSSDRGTKLSPVYMDALFSYVNMYSPGSVVYLSNGDLAIVVKENPRDFKVPYLKLLFNADMQPYEMDCSLDLSENKRIHIKKVLGHQEAEESMLKFRKIHMHS